MSAAPKLMTADEFLIWCLDQEGRWELVSGVPIRTMTGATNEHDDVVVNLLAALRTRLRGGPCRPRTADIASRMAGGNLRRPDVAVDCEPTLRGSLTSQRPTAFFEVLSPSTRGIDSIKKPDEYRAVPTLLHFVMLDPVMAYAWINSRAEDGGWRDHDVLSIDGMVSLPGIGVELPMSEIYEGVELES
jgi:Uma2 family endonuclease